MSRKAPGHRQSPSFHRIRPWRQSVEAVDRNSEMHLMRGKPGFQRSYRYDTEIHSGGRFQPRALKNLLPQSYFYRRRRGPRGRLIEFGITFGAKRSVPCGHFFKKIGFYPEVLPRKLENCVTSPPVPLHPAKPQPTDRRRAGSGPGDSRCATTSRSSFWDRWRRPDR